LKVRYEAIFEAVAEGVSRMLLYIEY
jgi:hypothetical protein